VARVAARAIQRASRPAAAKYGQQHGAREQQEGGNRKDRVSRHRTKIVMSARIRPP